MNNEYQNMFQQAINLFSQGEIQRAEDLCRKLINVSNKEPDVFNILAVIQDKKGNFDQAIKYMEKAINLNPNNHLYYTNIGEFYKKNGDIEKAISSLQKSIQINPDFHGSRYNLANIYKSIGYNQQAEQLYKEAIEINPDDYQSCQNLGNIYNESGNYISAAEYYFNGLRIVPDNYELSSSLADCFLHLKNDYQAEYYFRNTLAFKPDHLHSLKLLSVMMQNDGQFSRGIEYYKKYIECWQNKNNKTNVLHQLHLDIAIPFFDLTSFKIKDNREKLLKNIDKYEKSDIENDNFIDFVNENVQAPSQLAYHGIDNKKIKVKYAKIFDNCFPKKDLSFNTGIIKIGFLVTDGKANIFIKFMSKIINDLDTKDFEVFIICDVRDWNNYLKNNFSENIKPIFITDKLNDSTKNIESINLDILYYWEINTDSINYFLPFFRLAPVQCTSIGWPDTTGINTVDYFISSELIETPESDSHYSEKLVKFKKLPFNLEKPVFKKEIKSLEELGIDKDKNIYGCVQNFRKIHPDFDKIIADILRKDQNGIVVFVKHKSQGISELLKLRLEITNPDIFDRILFADSSDFSSVIHHSHVLLDSIYFGGATTSYDSFAMNKPVVTLPWTHERGRYTLGCYKQMGIDDLIANNSDEFVELAFKTANNKEFRDSVVSKIEANNHLLFNDNLSVKEYSEFFKSISRSQ